MLKDAKVDGKKIRAKLKKEKGNWGIHAIFQSRWGALMKLKGNLNSYMET
jgi:hypothetical protein